MSTYDDRFDATTLTQSVFADKRALNPLAEPDAIAARDAQERALATILRPPKTARGTIRADLLEALTYSRTFLQPSCQGSSPAVRSGLTLQSFAASLEPLESLLVRT